LATSSPGDNRWIKLAQQPLRLIKWQFGFPTIDHSGAMRRVRYPNGIYCQVKGLEEGLDFLESAAAESGGWLRAKSGIVLEERLLGCLLPRDSLAMGDV